MISLDKCIESYHVLYLKIFVPKETKGINLKAFNMSRNTNKLRQWQSIFHVIVNANSIVQNVIWIENGIIKRSNKNVKIIISPKQIMAGFLTHVFVAIANIWKTSSVIECDYIIDTVSTKMINILATHIWGTASTNCYSKKVRYCYILHTVLSVVILLLIIIIIWYYYAKQKGINALTI